MTSPAFRRAVRVSKPARFAAASVVQRRASRRTTARIRLAAARCAGVASETSGYCSRCPIRPRRAARRQARGPGGSVQTIRGLRRRSAARAVAGPAERDDDRQRRDTDARCAASRPREPRPEVVEERRAPCGSGSRGRTRPAANTFAPAGSRSRSSAPSVPRPSRFGISATRRCPRGESAVVAEISTPLHPKREPAPEARSRGRARARSGCSARRRRPRCVPSSLARYWTPTTAASGRGCSRLRHCSLRRSTGPWRSTRQWKVVGAEEGQVAAAVAVLPRSGRARGASRTRGGRGRRAGRSDGGGSRRRARGRGRRRRGSPRRAHEARSQRRNGRSYRWKNGGMPSPMNGRSRRALSRRRLAYHVSPVPSPSASVKLYACHVLVGRTTATRGRGTRRRPDDERRLGDVPPSVEPRGVDAGLPAPDADADHAAADGAGASAPRRRSRRRRSRAKRTRAAVEPETGDGARRVGLALEPRRERRGRGSPGPAKNGR